MLVDTTTIGVLRQVVDNKGEIELPAQGDSMFPFIQENDLCTFVQCDPSQLKRGDVALFYSDSGQLIAHRFYNKRQLDSNTYYVFKGDTNQGFDKPVRVQQIIGKLIRIEKETMEFEARRWYALAWAKMITSFPILSRLIRRYLNLKVQSED